MSSGSHLLDVVVHNSSLPLQQVCTLSCTSASTSTMLRQSVQQRSSTYPVTFKAKSEEKMKHFTAWLVQNMGIVTPLFYDNSHYSCSSDVDMTLVNALQQAAAATAEAAGVAAGTPGSSRSSSSSLPLQSLTIAELYPLQGTALLNHLGSNPEPYNALTHVELSVIPTQPDSLHPVAEALRGLASLRSLSSVKLRVDDNCGLHSEELPEEPFWPMLLPLQQLTSVTRLGVNSLQRQWAEHLPAQVQELQIVIDPEFRHEGFFSLAHCTRLTKLSSSYTLDLHGNESLPPSIRVLQVGNVGDADALMHMTPALQYLSMRQCSTTATELCKLTALTSLQELHLEYGMDTAGSFVQDDSWHAANDDDSCVNYSAAAWGELPMLRSLQLRCQERFSDDGPMSAAAVRQLGSAVGITSLVIDDCWIDAAPAELAAALSQLTRLQRLRLADLKWAPPAAAAAAAAAGAGKGGKAAAAAAAGAGAGGNTAEGAEVLNSSSSDNCAGGTSSDPSGINSGSDTDDEDNSSKPDSGSIPSASLACVLAAVAQLPNLVHLELARLPLQSRRTMRQLAAAPCITELSIRRCGLRVAGLRALASPILRLRALLLDGNPKLGSAAVALLMQLQPPVLQQLSINSARLDAVMLVRLLVGKGLRDEAKHSLLASTGWSESSVQSVMVIGGRLQAVHAQAASVLRSNTGLDAEQVLQLQAMLEAGRKGHLVCCI